jgi:hypothetical protein
MLGLLWTYNKMHGIKTKIKKQGCFWTWRNAYFSLFTDRSLPTNLLPFNTPPGSHAKVGNASLLCIYFYSYESIFTACLALFGVMVLCLHIAYDITYISRTPILAYFTVLSINDSIDRSLS